ncbi:MAG TPA: peptidoglycan-associated lipoprotein Pal [Aeromonadales bacterium]|nr:peptidoglycan-associated lipoprotein Pal [Aeromonadales bacterium]
MGKTAALVLSLAFLAACTTKNEDTNTNTNVTPPQDTAPVVKKLTPEEIAAKAKAEAEAKDAAVRQERTIYFDFDKSNIKDEFRMLIEAHAKFLAKNPAINVKLEGHADERGTPEYNIALGEARAKAIADIFKTFGVADSQMEVISYGEERPVDPGHNEAAWAKNRRVEIVYN